MAIPMYVVCKAKGSTITGVGCEVPKIEGKQILEENIYCQYEKLGGVFHYHFKILGDTLYVENKRLHFDNREVEIQINVRSHEGRKTPKLQYLFKENLERIEENEESFSLDRLANLDYGIKVFNYRDEKNEENNIALDYIRSNLFYMNEFRDVPTTSDLNQELHSYVAEAKNLDADIYIFGDLYPFECKSNTGIEERFTLLREYGPKGIHDIHMNQGELGEKRWAKDSGVYQDGGLLINFNSNEKSKWVGIFLKFDSQGV